MVSLSLSLSRSHLLHLFQLKSQVPPHLHHPLRPPPRPETAASCQARRGGGRRQRTSAAAAASLASFRSRLPPRLVARFLKASPPLPTPSPSLRAPRPVPPCAASRPERWPCSWPCGAPWLRPQGKHRGAGPRPRRRRGPWRRARRRRRRCWRCRCFWRFCWRPWGSPWPFCSPQRRPEEKQQQQQLRRKKVPPLLLLVPPILRRCWIRENQSLSR